jgi:hypothetical protein
MSEYLNSRLEISNDDITINVQVSLGQYGLWTKLVDLGPLPLPDLRCRLGRI